MISETEITRRIGLFKEDLSSYDDDEMIQKYFEHDFSPAVISNDDYFKLKIEVANFFTLLHPTEVFMVGSGKLGFTIKPQEQYRKFNDSSDIDLAIVSRELFELFWKAVFEYKNEVKYWPKELKFKDYLFKGWIRPDLLPPSNSFKESKEWWDFFRELTSSGKYGPYKINAGLYLNRFFFESYQKDCIQSCRMHLGE